MLCEWFIIDACWEELFCLYCFVLLSVSVSVFSALCNLSPVSHANISVLMDEVYLCIHTPYFCLCGWRNQSGFEPQWGDAKSKMRSDLFCPEQTIVWRKRICWRSTVIKLLCYAESLLLKCRHWFHNKLNKCNVVKAPPPLLTKKSPSTVRLSSGTSESTGIQRLAETTRNCLHAELLQAAISKERNNALMGNKITFSNEKESACSV